MVVSFSSVFFHANIITFSVPYLLRHKMVSAEYSEEKRKKHHINQTPHIKKTPKPPIHGQPRTVPHPAEFAIPFLTHQTVYHWVSKTL